MTSSYPVTGASMRIGPRASGSGFLAGDEGGCDEGEAGRGGHDRAARLRKTLQPDIGLALIDLG